MSRYEFPGRAPGYSIAVGWDAPLQTFFAQVMEDELDGEDDDGIILWLGGSPGEFPAAESMIPLLDQYADIRPMIATLNADRDNSDPPTPLQRFGARIFQ